MRLAALAECGSSFSAVIYRAGSDGATVCPGCGLILPAFDGSSHPYVGASAACWNMFATVLAREYGDPAYMVVHRLTVDAYCAQHPGIAGRRAIQSVNVHLAGLQLVLDRGATDSFARTAIGTITDRLAARLTWLEPPDTLGDLTIADVAEAASATVHCARVRAWAASVWGAWTIHHPAIRLLASDAILLM